MLPIARHRVAVGLGALVVAIIFWSPAWLHPSATGFGDWQMVHHNWEVGFTALTRFHEWPLWNPFFCGGITAFGNPESQWFSPLTWPALITGTTIGTKIFLTVHAALGVSGMFIFAHSALGLRTGASVLCAAAWGCSGFFAWHGAGGHATFLPFYFAPWLLLCVRRSVHDLRYAIGAAAILALTLYEGGTYPFPYFVLWIALDVLFVLVLDADGASHGTSRRPFLVAMSKALALIGVLTLLLGAVRLLPIADALSRMPRDTTSDDSIAVAEVIEMLTARDHAWRYPPHRFVWPEYGTFVGWSVVVLAAFGVVVAWRRRQRWVIAGLGLFLWLVLGEGGPWSWLHALPVFDSLRVPSRFMVLFTFYLALLAGLGLDAIAAWLQTHRDNPTLGWTHHAVVPLVVLISMADLFSVNLRTIDRWDGPPIVQGPAAERFHLVRTRNFHHLYASLPARHQGIAGCYNGGMNWVVSPALWSGDVPQVRVEPLEAGALIGFERTVNSITLRVQAQHEPTRLVINQNFDRDIRTDVGEVLEDRGRLALDVPAGDHVIHLRYQPPTLFAGLALSGLGWLLSVLGFGVLSRRMSTGST